MLVLYDGHHSHIALALVEWACDNNIILFVLPYKLFTYSAANGHRVFQSITGS